MINIYNVTLRVILLRSFAIQKALFFFTGLFFSHHLFAVAPDFSLENKNRDEQSLKDNKVTDTVGEWHNRSYEISDNSCSIHSIRKQQQLYEFLNYNENTNKPANTLTLKKVKDNQSKPIKNISYKVAGITKHDERSYTQGFVYFDGYLYESSGGLGNSTISKVELLSGEVSQLKFLPQGYFAEGLDRIDKRLVQITLKKNKGFVYALESLEVIGEFTFPGDGWGLVALNNDFLVSDGSAVLSRISGSDYKKISENKVTVNGLELQGINEMENVKGMIYANIWPTDCIAIINPAHFNVIAWIDLSELYPSERRKSQSSVLNGIAFNPSQNRLLVTGKNWQEVYHLELKNYPDGH